MTESMELQDPVCGMEVNDTSKYQSQLKTKDYYFCSLKCKTKFDVAPQNYVKQESYGHFKKSEQEKQPQTAAELSSDVETNANDKIGTKPLIKTSKDAI